MLRSMRAAERRCAARRVEGVEGEEEEEEGREPEVRMASRVSEVSSGEEEGGGWVRERKVMRGGMPPAEATTEASGTRVRRVRIQGAEEGGGGEGVENVVMAWDGVRGVRSEVRVETQLPTCPLIGVVGETSGVSGG